MHLDEGDDATPVAMCNLDCASLAAIYEAVDQSSSLSILPFEIQLLVVDLLSSEDRKNFALACKSFANATTEKRFARVVLSYTSGSVERLVHIGQNDHLRKHVKTLTWDRQMVHRPGYPRFQHVEDLFPYESRSPERAL